MLCYVFHHCCKNAYIDKNGKKKRKRRNKIETEKEIKALQIKSFTEFYLTMSQSIYTIEHIKGIIEKIRRNYGIKEKSNKIKSA